MKSSFLAIFILLSFCSNSQFNKIPSGSIYDWDYISVIGNDIYFHGSYYLCEAKSTNDCQVITNLSPGAQPPSPSQGNSYQIFVQRLDLKHKYTLAQHRKAGWQTYTSGINGVLYYFPITTEPTSNITFLDTLEGYITKSNGYYKTIDGGASWNANAINGLDGILYIAKSYKDSCISLVGAKTGVGSFCYLSYDKGLNWSYRFIDSIKNGPIDFAYVNKDTIISLTYWGTQKARFSFSGNRGQSWSTHASPIDYARKIYIKSSKEIYLVGSDVNSNGIIAKSVDFGMNWVTINTGYQTNLMDMAVLNDSIAVVCGTGGHVLRWNYKLINLTNISKNALNTEDLNIFPNPVNKHLSFSLKNSVTKNLDLRLFNIQGQILLLNENFTSSKSLDLSELEKGIYFLSVRFSEGDNRQKVFKVIKE